MIRSITHEGIAYSVVETEATRRIFVAIQPHCQTTFEQQTEEALRSLGAVFRKEDAAESMLMQTVFLADIENQPKCRRLLRDFYGEHQPATTYVHQPPCEGRQLAIEAWGVGASEKLEIHRFDEAMVAARHEGIEWIYLADGRHETPIASIYDHSLAAFHAACGRLCQAGAGWNDVIRTWLYLGRITAPERQTSRYLELNRARADYFRNREFGKGLVPRGWPKPVFPASTGIGMNGRDLTLGCLALKTQRPDVLLLPLENPRQTAAYDYAHQYGSESPKFARAMAIVAGESVAVFISGTASITASDTRHVGDFKRQIEQTLDNIEVLISSDNFAAHGFPAMGATFDDLAIARVYLKRPEDFAQAWTICRKRWGQVPAIFVQADICRDGLLVEIEALAFSRRRSSGSSD